MITAWQGKGLHHAQETQATNIADYQSIVPAWVDYAAGEGVEAVFLSAPASSGAASSRLP